MARWVVGESRMRGRVLWYRPNQGAGVITSDDGAEVGFETSADSQKLQGGDLVEFVPNANGGQIQAMQVRLVKRCIDDLIDAHRPLVDEFHSTVQILH